MLALQAYKKIIVLSPVKSSKMILLPPEGAVFLERSACTIPTVSALTDEVRQLNRELSVSAFAVDVLPRSG